MVDTQVETENSFEICVIGAGVVGSSTALALAKSGRKVILLEQFGIPHNRGSSCGQSRIFRLSYPDWKHAQFLEEALQLWREIETESGTDLLKMVGYLSIEDDDDDDEFFRANLNQLERQGQRPQILNTEDLRKRYPQLNFGENVRGFFETKAGVLNASKCCASLLKLFQAKGGTVRDLECVKQVLPGRKIQIVTNKAEYTVDKVVLTCGTYSTPLVRELGLNLPLKPLGVRAMYWPIKDSQYEAGNGFPIISHRIGDNLYAYSLPCHEYPGLIKICLHQGTEINPSKRSFDMAKSLDDIEFLSKYISKHYKGVEPSPAIVEECMYCTTPDYDFIIDVHPNYPNVVIGTGFSGHGFKMAPVIGKILAEICYGNTSSYDISACSLKRFGNYKSSL